MSTKIQWTDETWNPTTGCTRVSEGCRHCYIERTPAFRIHGRKFVNGTTGVQLHPDRIDTPLHWRKPRRVFVNSLSDLFHEDIPFEFIEQVFGVIGSSQRHTFQVLTKRPARMLEFMRLAPEWWSTTPPIVYHDTGYPPRNLWLGVSVEDQATADERIPILLDTPAAVRFISAEPLLGPVDITPYLTHVTWQEMIEHQSETGHENCQSVALDWVILGGESGPGARRCDVDWIRQLKNQCQTAKVPVFVKQLGEKSTSSILTRLPTDDWVSIECHKDKKNGDPAEWPADLRVREYPNT